MPRNDAADRYSPEIAAAFHDGVIARDATKRSDVVRAKRTPYRPSETVAPVTARIAASAITRRRPGRGTNPRAPPPAARTARRCPPSAGTAATRWPRSATGRRARRRPAGRAAGRWRAAASRRSRRTRRAPPRSASAASAPAGAGTGRRGRWPRPARRVACAAAASHRQLPAQLTDLAAGDRHLGAVAHHEHRGPVQPRAHLHRAAQVDHEPAVHPDEAVRDPALLELRQPGAEQEPPLVGRHADVVAVRLQVEDRR